VVRLAATQGLCCLAPLDELPDLDTGCREHRDELVVDVADLASEQLDDADGRACADHRKRDCGAQPDPALRARLLVVVPGKVVHRGGDP